MFGRPSFPSSPSIFNRSIQLVERLIGTMGAKVSIEDTSTSSASSSNVSSTSSSPSTSSASSTSSAVALVPKSSSASERRSILTEKEKKTASEILIQVYDTEVPTDCLVDQFNKFLKTTRSRLLFKKTEEESLNIWNDVVDEVAWPKVLLDKSEVSDYLLKQEYQKIKEPIKRGRGRPRKLFESINRVRRTYNVKSCLRRKRNARQRKVSKVGRKRGNYKLEQKPILTSPLRDVNDDKRIKIKRERSSSSTDDVTSAKRVKRTKHVHDEDTKMIAQQLRMIRSKLSISQSTVCDEVFKLTGHRLTQSMISLFELLEASPRLTNEMKPVILEWIKTKD